MDLSHIIVLLIVGGVAGWLAGQLVKGNGFGLIGDIIVGIIGGFIGGWLFSQLGVTSPGGEWVGLFVTSLVGAVILTYVIRFFRR